MSDENASQQTQQTEPNPEEASAVEATEATTPAEGESQAEPPSEQPSVTAPPAEEQPAEAKPSVEAPPAPPQAPEAEPSGDGESKRKSEVSVKEGTEVSSEAVASRDASRSAHDVESATKLRRQSSILRAELMGSAASVGHLSDKKSGLSFKGRQALGSVISIRRSSMGDILDKTKAARYMNTYRLESEHPFKHELVENILEAVILEALQDLTYDPEKCGKQAKWASSAIRAQVKELKFDRYKLVCLVTIGEKNSQDVLATCRFLWDVDRDGYAIYAHENTYVYGYAQCFGLYYE